MGTPESLSQLAREFENEQRFNKEYFASLQVEQRELVLKILQAVHREGIYQRDDFNPTVDTLHDYLSRPTADCCLGMMIDDVTIGPAPYSPKHTSETGQIVKDGERVLKPGEIAATIDTLGSCPTAPTEFSTIILVEDRDGNLKIQDRICHVYDPGYPLRQSLK